MAVKKVRDPIHNYIYLDEPTQAVIANPRFQRLRRIHQLGTANLVYPGANHTRFEHSLGAHHLATLATEALGVSREEALEVRMAALLHDIGHGPFSHLTEPIIHRSTGKEHEDYSSDLITRGTLKDTLAGFGVDPKRVTELIHGHGFLAPIVSSELDVDRMDYLVRDSHYTGVAIGVDLHRLVTDMALAPAGLALRESAIQAAEMILVTRFMMYGTVYFHPTSRIAEVMLERAIELAMQGGEITGHELAAMDDIDLMARLRASKTLAWNFVHAVDQRHLMKLAAAFTLDQVGRERATDLSGDHERRRGLEVEIAAKADVHPLDVVVDAPPPPSLTGSGVAILTADGRVRPLRDLSPLVAGLAAAQAGHWRLSVMAPKEARERVAAAAHQLLLA